MYIRPVLKPTPKSRIGLAHPCDRVRKKNGLLTQNSSSTSLATTPNSAQLGKSNLTHLWIQFSVFAFTDGGVLLPCNKTRTVKCNTVQPSRSSDPLRRTQLLTKCQACVLPSHDILIRFSPLTVSKHNSSLNTQRAD